MASKVTGLKGWRTRCRDTLQMELQVAEDLWRKSVREEFDIEQSIENINKCIEILNTYSEKLQIQSEKLIDELTEDDQEFLDEVLNEDWKLMCDVGEMNVTLKHVKQKMLTKIKKQITDAAPVKPDRDIVELQTIIDFMKSQNEQQQEFINRQESKVKSYKSVKLPKLDLVTFSGDKLEWTEFWHCLVCSVHDNKGLSDVEKFSYLQSKLKDEAKTAVTGLALTNTNYKVALSILRDRYGNKQEVIDMHYSKMIKLSQPTNKTESLRQYIDEIEKHLRRLEVLDQNVDQDIFVSIIKSKIPKDVLMQMELRKGSLDTWTVTNLRKELKEYVSARERTEHDVNTENQQSYNHKGVSSQNKGPSFSFAKTPSRIVRSAGRTVGSAEALVVNSKESEKKRYSDQCRYCNLKHWSDECPKYPTIHERKKQLKNSCFKCLQVGHTSTNCKKDKLCVHCGEKNTHHRSLCPKKFKLHVTAESIHCIDEVSTMCDNSENIVQEGIHSVLGQGFANRASTMVSTGEMVLMQTAKTDVKNPSTYTSTSARIRLDCGSQRTYITKNLAEKLKLQKGDDQEIKLVILVAINQS